MFCSKCGTELTDGAAFCYKCGTKLIGDDMKEQVPASTLNKPVQQMQQQSQAVIANVPKKKKSGKLLIGLGAAVIVAIVAIIIALQGNGKIDYVATVGAHTPFAASQGLPYTYGEVLNKYIVSPKWEVRESGDAHYVDISGTLKGMDNKLIITIKAISDPYDSDIVLMSPESVTLNDEKSPTQNDAVEFLFVMFSAYDEGYDDLSVLMSSIEMLEPSIPAEPEFSNELSEDDKWDMVSVWLHTHGITDYYMCPASELGNDDLVYDDSDLYFEVSGYYGTLPGIISFDDNDIFITFPILVDPDNGEWLKTDIYPIEDWYNYIWDGRYDDASFGSDYDNRSRGFRESLEYYSGLSGSYEGSTGQSSLSISIYSSWEETSIGTVGMYIGDEWNYLGEITAELEKDVYLVETDTGEEIVLDVYSYEGTIVIGLYVDGEYIDEYWMVEHYVS